MKTKLFCRRCGEELIGDGGWCHVCRENKGDADVEERYFPDDPKNRVYAVDVYVTVCKSVKVEAVNSKDAEERAYGMFETALNVPEPQDMEVLREAGFHYADDIEVEASGEADENGDIRYY